MNYNFNLLIIIGFIAGLHCDRNGKLQLVAEFFRHG